MAHRLCYSDGFAFANDVNQEDRPLLLIGDSLARGLNEDSVDTIAIAGVRVEGMFEIIRQLETNENKIALLLGGNNFSCRETLWC